MSPAPFVSVLMSVHNGRRFVGQAIDSILTQSLSNFEFIIIDDGSTDGVTAELHRYARKDNRIRLIVQQNIGLTRSLNRGLGIAKGEFIARMDADDISLPRRLELQADFLRRRPDYACVGSSAVYIDNKGRRLFIRRMPTSHEAICRAHLANFGGMILHPSALIRRSAIERIGGYDERMRYAQDYDLWCRLAVQHRLANLANPLICYRFHDSGITQAKSDDQTKAAREILGKELQRARLTEPLALEPAYALCPTDHRWLRAAALRDGFYTTYVHLQAKRVRAGLGRRIGQQLGHAADRGRTFLNRYLR